MVIMGIALVLMETIMVVYWYVMDSIGWDVKSYWKNAQKHNRKCNDLMVIMGIALVLMKL